MVPPAQLPSWPRPERAQSLARIPQASGKHDAACALLLPESADRHTISCRKLCEPRALPGSRRTSATHATPRTRRPACQSSEGMPPSPPTNVQQQSPCPFSPPSGRSGTVRGPLECPARSTVPLHVLRLFWLFSSSPLHSAQPVPLGRPRNDHNDYSSWNAFEHLQTPQLPPSPTDGTQDAHETSGRHQHLATA